MTRARTRTCANCRTTLYGVGSDFRWFIGKGRHDLVRETTEALPRAAAAQNHVFDASTTQAFELAHDLVWRADQAVRLLLLRAHDYRLGYAIRRRGPANAPPPKCVHGTGDCVRERRPWRPGCWRHACRAQGQSPLDCRHTHTPRARP